MKGFTEEQVWKEFRIGNEDALSYIYQKYSNVLYNYGRQFTPNGEIVKDVIHDLFCELIKSREKLGATDSIKFYLMACLRNRLIRTLKYKENHKPIEDCEYSFALSLNEDIPGDDFFAPNMNRIIEEAFSKLPPRQKEALLLHYYENLSYQQISVNMQIGKVKSARALIYRALESLRLCSVISQVNKNGKK